MANTRLKTQLTVYQIRLREQTDASRTEPQIVNSKRLETTEQFSSNKDFLLLHFMSVNYISFYALTI
jgi:hypothetical protein